MRGKVLFDGGIIVGLAKVVFRKIDVLRLAMYETHGSVLPIADVVAEADVQDGVAQVVRVEEEPESVDDAVLFRHNNKNGRSTASSTFLRTMPLTRVAITLPKLTMRTRCWLQWVWAFSSERITGLATVPIVLSAIPID